MYGLDVEGNPILNWQPSSLFVPGRSRRYRQPKGARRRILLPDMALRRRSRVARHDGF